MQEGIPYAEVIDLAMRGVVREILRTTAKNGLPGEHHFYISFRTQFPGARISDSLRGRYPQDMTIVLQHQYWDFKVEDTQFQVTLSFGGVPEKLVIPFAAMTAFADPSVKFGLQFQVAADAETPAEKPLVLQDTGDENHEMVEATLEGEKVVSINAFRKK